MIVNDKFNNEEKDFFIEESINPIKKSSQKLKIKEVSIDINKSKNNSYKNMLFKYQKKNNNITTLNNYTEENQQEINYIKTDNNINDLLQIYQIIRNKAVSEISVTRNQFLFIITNIPKI